MRWTVLMLAMVAGCSGKEDGVPGNATVVALQPSALPRPPVSTATTQPCTPHQDSPCSWVGRWTGVEGMMLDIAPANEAGRYMLTMQWDLDHRGMFTGDATSEPAAPTIGFDREGRMETLRRTDGDATGLKYLAGKKDCLTVKRGEGYCRD